MVLAQHDSGCSETQLMKYYLKQMMTKLLKTRCLSLPGNA